MKIQALRICIGIIFLTSILNAQINDIRFNNISLDDGLSNSFVTSIIQDRLGFMWFGTKEGLNKYDGYDFKIYKYDPADINSLSDNYVTSIIESRDSILWIGTKNGGLNKFDPATENFTHIKHESGNLNSLTTNAVSYIYEDPDSLNDILWIGTFGGGLNKYDRKSKLFKSYKQNPAENNSISNNFAMAIHKDKTGILWVGTYDGLNSFNPQNEDWTQYFYDPTNPLSISNSDAKCIYEDSEGILWVGSGNRFSKIIRKKNMTQSSLNKRNSIEFNNISTAHSPFSWGPLTTAIGEDQFGKLWIGALNGLIKFDKETGEFTHYFCDPGNSQSISGNMINAIYKDAAGLLWIGTESGISILRHNSENFNCITHIPDNLNSLSNPSVRGIFEDSEGILWVGGYKGLNRIDRTLNRITHYDKSNSEINHDPVYAISGDNQNKEILWLGMEGLGAFCRFNKNSGRTDHYTTRFGASSNLEGKRKNSNYIFDIHSDSNGILWLATDYGLNKFDIKNETITNYLNDPDDFQSISGNKTRVIYEDSGGSLWIGTESEGICLLTNENKKTGKFKRFQNDPSGQYSLSNDQINSIYQDHSGTLWIGTNGGGLFKLSKENVEIGKFQHFGEKDGLPNNVVYGILEDENNNLWLSTNNGLSRFNMITGEFTNFDINDGLQSNEFNSASYFKSKSGEMFFGGINGLNTFYPDKILDHSYIPLVVITDFQIYSESIKPGFVIDDRVILKKHISKTNEIELTYKEDAISFEFAAMNFAAPDKNLYKYKIEGINKDWVNTDASRRFASYPHLDPDTYVFQVKSASLDGVWSEKITSIKIIIAPPNWKTWWAFTIYFIGIVGSILGFVRWRSFETIKRTRHLEHMVKERTTEIENQKRKLEIQAHELIESDKIKSRFFANISHEFHTPLTLIKGPLESLRAKKYGDISQLADKHLNMIINNVNRLQSLIDELSDLSKLEAGKLKLKTTKRELNKFTKMVVEPFYEATLNSNISFNLLLSENDIDLFFDVHKLEKILSNILSNALKFTPKNGKITIAVEDAELITVEYGAEVYAKIKISDSGIGLSEKDLPHIFDRFFQVEDSNTRKYEGTGIGLALTKELIELHGGEIEVESKIGEGTTFIISLPKGCEHLSEEEIFENVDLDTDFVDKKQVNIDVTKRTKDTNIEQKRILVVEDNNELRSYLADHLESKFNVIEASNGEQGLEKAIALLPDLIISDIMMPIMDGLEMTLKIREHELTNSIPIIMLTARADDEDRIAGLKIEVDDYISKPFNLEEVLLRVDNLIKIRENLKSIYAQEITTIELNKLNLESADQALLEKILTVTETNLSNPNFDVAVLAKSVFLSKRQLERKINQLVGQTPADFIRQIRLKRAKQYLEEKAYTTVTEVSNNVGFKNAKYFSRLYNQAFECNPSCYFIKGDRELS